MYVWTGGIVSRPLPHCRFTLGWDLLRVFCRATPADLDRPSPGRVTHDWPGWAVTPAPSQGARLAYVLLSCLSCPVTGRNTDSEEACCGSCELLKQAAVTSAVRD